MFQTAASAARGFGGKSEYDAQQVAGAYSTLCQGQKERKEYAILLIRVLAMEQDIPHNCDCNYCDDANHHN